SIPNQANGFQANGTTGMEIIDGFLYYTRTDNNLYRIAMVNGAPVSGTVETLSGPAIDGQSWDGNDFFVTEGVPPTGDDTTPPTLFLNPPAEMTVQQGFDFNDPGATAIDDFDGNISDEIVVTGTVDT